MAPIHPGKNQPRLVLRDRYGDYCVSGLADKTQCPAYIRTERYRFKLVRVTPTYVLYQEVNPRPQEASR